MIPDRTVPFGYQSDMPAYGSVLSDEAIRAALAYIKSSWPHQALQAQKDMTLKQLLNDQASFFTLVVLD